MKRRLELAWFNFAALFRWYRIVGIAALSLVAYFLAFVVFGKTDVSWLFPQSALRFQWPDLPYFSTRHEVSSDGKTQATYYTVPTRQITPQELRQLSGTNQTARPAK